MNESESETNNIQRFQRIKENQSLVKSISDLFDFKVENNKKLHEKITDNLKVKQDTKRDRQDQKDERKSKLAEMTKNVFLSTKLGKTYQGVADLVNDKKTKIEDAFEKTKNKAIAGGVNALGKIGGADVKIDTNDLYDENKNVDNGPTNDKNIDKPVELSESQDTLKDYINHDKPGELTESQDTLKDYINQDTSDLEEKFQKGHEETLHEVKGIRDDIYDFTHKQDSSITKKPKKGKNSGLSVALNAAAKKGSAAASGDGSDADGDFGILEFLAGKNLFKAGRNTKPKKTLLSKTKTRLKKGIKKIPGGKTALKNISKATKNLHSLGKSAGNGIVKNTPGLAKTIGAAKSTTNTIKGIGSGAKGLSKGAAKFIPGLATVATIGMGAYDFATSDNDKGRKEAVGGTAGAAAGAWAGGEAGAAAGLLFGPGAVVMSPLLGIIGAVGGGMLGSKYGKELTDFLFSDIDDSIPDEQKENPFSFYAALENIRPNLVQELQKTKDKDKREDIIDKINELNDKEKEVTSRDELKDWLEDEIETDKKSPKLKDKSEEDIAKALITSDKIPTKYRADLVDIYNKDIAGGIFASDGNLSLSNQELTKAKTTNSATNSGSTKTPPKIKTEEDFYIAQAMKDDDKYWDKLSTSSDDKATLSNQQLGMPKTPPKDEDNIPWDDITPEDPADDFFANDKVTLSNQQLGIPKTPKENNSSKPSNTKKSRTKRTKSTKDIITNGSLKSIPEVGSISSFIDMYSSDSGSDNSNTKEKPKISNNISSSGLKDIKNESFIKNKDTSSNMNVSNITKQLINSTNSGSEQPQIVKETLQPVIQQVAVPPQKTSDNTVSMASFGNSEQDIIASEMIGGF